MGFYLQIEVTSCLSPAEFRERVAKPLQEALEQEKLGRLLDDDPEDATSDGVYELALEVSDQLRAKELIERVLKSVDG
jgi:hypothetical protein